MLRSGAFCRQVSIAVWPWAWSPPVSAAHTTCLEVAGAEAEASTVATPNPLRNPLWRRVPTLTPGARASNAALGVCPAGSARGGLRCLGSRPGGLGLRVPADQLAGLEVVGGEQRVGAVLRVGGGVEREGQD